MMKVEENISRTSLTEWFSNRVVKQPDGSVKIEPAKYRTTDYFDLPKNFLGNQPNEQKIIMKELLSSDEYKTVESLLGNKKFNIVKFIDKLDNLILKTNPEILVYTGEKNKDYNYLHNQIKTIYDNKITEGFKIVYKGVVYDYSI